MKDKTKKESSLWRKIKMSKQIYFILLPVLIWLIVYSYVPLYGIVLAWKNYSPSKGILGSDWAGWVHFEKLFADPYFKDAIFNSIRLSLIRLLITFPAPLILALLINEVRSTGYRRFVQTLTYLPHFISWTIISGIIKTFLAPEATGPMNSFIASFGLAPIEFLNEPDLFIPILMIAELWKGAGWSSIIYLASIMGIDGTMYEAAEIDGCSRLGKVWFITIPSIMPTIAMQLVLSIANILNAGFDSIYNLYNSATAGVAETIDTLAYKTFLTLREREVATAMGLFKTAVNFVLMIGGNILTKKITGYSMYTFDN